MIKRSARTKSPLLASEWPAVRLTVARWAALMIPGLRTAGSVRERRGAGGGSGPRPSALAHPSTADPSSVQQVAGELHPLKNARNVRGGLMGNFATVDAGQEQHLRALEYANRVRLARARMKRKVAVGDLSAAEVVLSCPWQAHSMSISDLLMSQKRWGRTRCRRLLVSLGVPENKQVGTLTDRQRLALAAVLTAKNAPIGVEEEPETRAVSERVPALSAA